MHKKLLLKWGFVFIFSRWKYESIFEKNLLHSESIRDQLRELDPPVFNQRKISNEKLVIIRLVCFVDTDAIFDLIKQLSILFVRWRGKLDGRDDVIVTRLEVVSENRQI